MDNLEYYMALWVDSVRNGTSMKNGETPSPEAYEEVERVFGVFKDKFVERRKIGHLIQNWLRRSEEDSAELAKLSEAENVETNRTDAAVRGALAAQSSKFVRGLRRLLDQQDGGD